MIKNNSKYNVIIIGSGFSGIVAADILAEHDLSILLIDENIHIGGQGYLVFTVVDDVGDIVFINAADGNFVTYISLVTPEYTVEYGCIAFVCAI